MCVENHTFFKTNLLVLLVGKEKTIKFRCIMYLCTRVFIYSYMVICKGALGASTFYELRRPGICLFDEIFCKDLSAIHEYYDWKYNKNYQQIKMTPQKTQNARHI